MENKWGQEHWKYKFLRNETLFNSLSERRLKVGKGGNLGREPWKNGLNEMILEKWVGLSDKIGIYFGINGLFFKRETCLYHPINILIY